MNFEIIDTEKYTIKIDAPRNYMEFLIKPGITFEADDARQSRIDVISRWPGVKFYVFAEGMEFFRVTREAREICATKEHLDNTLAVAFFTKNISILLLGEMFMKINKPAVPTKIFNSREKAEKWLEEQRERTGLH